MTIDFATKLAVIVGYCGLVGVGIYGFTALRSPIRRTLALGWVIVAVGWLSFYIVVVSGLDYSGSDDIALAALLSRLLHFPIIGLGISTVVMFLDREHELAAIWEVIETEVWGNE